MMYLDLMLLLASSIVSTVNFLVTIFRLRAPGMSLMRPPLFTWGWIFTSLLMLWAFPAFVSALSLLVADRAFGTVFFTSSQGGPLLWDHMFWFFGHPEVYVLLLPGFAIVGDLLSTFSRRPLYAKKIIIPCLAIASILSFTVWAHHMFMTGISQSLLEAFNVTTELISIPFAIIVIAYILTLRGGSIRFATPMLFAVGSLGLFTFGISQLIMFANLLWSARRGPAADKDPWGGYSLEWGVPSPPPEFNFPEGVPVISATGVTYRPVAMADGGHADAGYGAGSHEEHWRHWPIVVAAGAGTALRGLLMSLPGLYLGTGIRAAAFIGWGRETLRGRFPAPIEAVGATWPFARLENVSLGMWIFIFGEIAFFGTLFGAYVFLRMNSPLTGFVWPRPGEVHNIFWGGFNTIILLTSGLTMVFALTFARRGSYRGLQGSLVATFALGAFFMVNKAFEWHE